MTTAKPTALWVVPVADLGGVARHVMDASRSGLPGWRLVVLCPEGPLADRLRGIGAAVVTGPFGPAAGFRASCRTLRHILRGLRPAVVHSHLSYADVVCAFVLMKDRQIKLVTTEHGIAADDLVYHGSVFSSRIKAVLHSARLRRADAIIAVSHATRTAMIEKWNPRTPVSVIRNGVDPIARPLGGDSAVASFMRGGLRVLSLSRLAPEKRISELLHAFAALLTEHPGATLIVAGEGPILSELEALVERLGITRAVEFVGFIEPAEAMASADVLVQLSTWENCSYTLLDAVNAGLGVVATAVGGNPEILPKRCLVHSENPGAVAPVIWAQGTEVTNRPSLPADWPDAASMSRRIIETYAGIIR